MTRLNPEQEKSLTKVAEVKERLDVTLARLKAEHEQSVDSAKDGLRDAVATAVWAGVPARRIGEAIGSSDHKTIKSYFPLEDGMTIKSGGKN